MPHSYIDADIRTLDFSELATIEWAKLAAEWLGIQLGNDTEQVLQMQSAILNPQSHPVWGYRTPMDVGGPGLHDPSTCNSCLTD